MKLRLTHFLLSVCLLSTTLAFGQGFLSEKILKGAAIKDFDYLRSALEQGHAGLYWYRDSIEVTQLFDSLRREITDDISNTDYHLLLKAALETFSCGHSTVSFPKSYIDEVDSMNAYIPLRVKLIGNSVFILEDFSDQKIPPGSELISINGVPIAAIVGVLMKKVPTDKDISSKQVRSLDYLFPYYLALYYGVTADFNIEYHPPSSEEMITKVLPAMPQNEHLIKSPREIYHNAFPLEFRLDKESSIAYLTIDSFEPKYFKGAGVNFEDTLAQIFQQVKLNKIDNMILDLRGNIGGSMGYGEMLFSFFIEQPTKYYRNAFIKKAVAEANYPYAELRRLKERFESMYTLTPDKDNYIMSNADSVTPSPERFEGALYILSNGLSFSSTACFIAQCKDKSRAMLIGEQPGGAYSGLNTSPNIDITLPKTSYRLFFRSTLINLAEQEEKVGIKVDHEVVPEIMDVVNGIDPEMQYAVKLITDH
jgi:hypothetical protein